MKNKKVLSIILSVLAIFCLSLGAACSSKPIELVDFEDQTVLGSLYTDFSLNSYVIVSDTEGNIYRATVNVKDANGQEVGVYFNRFEPTMMGNYTATISVKVGKATKSRTIIIDVKDRSTPRISLLDNIYVGTVGSEYILPAFEVKKLTEEPVSTTSKLYKVDGDDKVEITNLVNDRFTPNDAGDYLFEITAVDQFNTTVQKAYPIKIRPQMAVNMLEDFDDELSAFNANAYGCDGARAGTYHQEFEGATGVVQIYSPRSQNCAAVRFNKTYEELAALGEFDAIVFRIYIDMAGSTHAFKIGSKFANVACKEWVDFSVTKAELLGLSGLKGSTDAEKWDSFCRKFSITGNGQYMFSHQDGANDMTIYVDSIKLEKRAPLAANMLEDFNHQTTATNVQFNQYGTCDGSGAGSWWNGTYHQTFQGATGVVQINGHSEGAVKAVPIRFSRTETELLAIMQNLESITYRVYVESSYWFVPVGQSGRVLQPGWHDITVSKAELLTGTTVEDFCKAHCDTGSGVGNTFTRANDSNQKIYIDYISFTSVSAANN